MKIYFARHFPEKIVVKNLIFPPKVVAHVAFVFVRKKIQILLKILWKNARYKPDKPEKRLKAIKVINTPVISQNILTKPDKNV